MVKTENLNHLQMANLMVNIIDSLEKYTDDKLQEKFKADSHVFKLIYISIIRTLQFVYLNEVESEEEKTFIKEKLMNESKNFARMLNEIMLDEKD